MGRDIFGEDTYREKKYHGLTIPQILIIVLSIISLIMAIVIWIKFELVTALIAMGIASILTTAIPVVVFLGIIFYIIIRIKWRRRRYFW